MKSIANPRLRHYGAGMITSEKWEKLQARMEALGIHEQDLAEHFIRGSGSGGQKINKTSSCVQMNHGPSGIEIRCQKTRSQADNRYWARKELCERIEEKVLGDKSKKQQAMEKIRDLIAKEDTAKPLSDLKLTNMLKEQGLTVARRTVAKYREEIGIPSSHLRKEY